MEIFAPRQLPPGFPETLDHTAPSPVAPRPAATVALLRPGKEGVEVLLLKRSPRTRFIPEAYVFPGGVVDSEDGAPSLLRHLTGVGEADARARLGIQEGEPPARSFFLAAIRETYEETGVLLGWGGPPPAQGGDRSLLLALEAPGAQVDGRVLEYCGHWITPLPEPRRYDTRFFCARFPEGARVSLHRGEMSGALWLSPAQALEANRSGALPMVYPTLKTLEALLPFRDPQEALAVLGSRLVLRRLPRLVRLPEGIGILEDE